MDIGTDEDLIARLSSALTEEPDRRIAWVTGSGISVPAVPSTREMAHIFRTALGEPPPSPETHSAAKEYRRLAAKVKLRKGPATLGSLVRSAVAKAAGDFVGAGIPSLDDPSWNLPPQQSALARIVSLVPEHRRGPIFTTNFDPLTEVALMREGLRARAVSAAGLSPVGFDVSVGEIPVVHIHGFWDKGSTLSTSDELEFDREILEEQLASIFERTLVICVGYGGWDDSFTRAVSKFLKSSQMHLADAELLWLHHGDAANDGLIADIRGAGIVSEYSGIALEYIVSTLSDTVHNALRPQIPSVVGLTLVPDRLAETKKLDIRRFVEGTQPTFEVAAAAPVLAITKELILAIRSNGKVDACFVALGPTGEGKSLALQQVALSLQSVGNEDAVAVYLQPGSRVPSVEVLAEFRRRFGVTYLFVDEADLVIDRLVESVRESRDESGVILLVMAMHSQYAHKVDWERRRDTEPWIVKTFGGITDDDSRAIASFWLQSKLLPERYQSRSAGEIGEMLSSGAVGVAESSLFGAVLHLWGGEGLRERVADLLVRLDRMKLGDVSFRRIFEAVSLVHSAWASDDDVFAEGLPEDAVALWCGISSHDVVRLVLRPLGREAAITTVGSDIFARHPSISDAVVSCLGDSDFMALAAELGRIGGTMRVSSERGSRHHVLTSLPKKLSGDAAVACAKASMTASGLLESRVTYMSILRQEDRSSVAKNYARVAAAHLQEFSDYAVSVRGFYVEWSVNERVSGDFRTAVRLSCISLSDLVNRPPSLDQVRYGLVNVFVALNQVGHSDPLRTTLGEDCLDMLRIVPGGAGILKSVGNRGFPERSVHQLVSDFRLHSLGLEGGGHVRHWRFSGLLSCLASADMRKASGRTLRGEQ